MMIRATDSFFFGAGSVYRLWGALNFLGRCVAVSSGRRRRRDQKKFPKEETQMKLKLKKSKQKAPDNKFNCFPISTIKINYAVNAVPNFHAS